jgi:HD-GYP domain-containing protein (c-di-GMP phosphodiesterase class II)
MSDTRILRHRIADLRNRLGQWPTSAHEPIERQDDGERLPPPRHLYSTVVPAKLGPEARAVLQECRACVHAIQELAAIPCMESADHRDPLFRAQDRCAAMAEAAVRMAQTLPSDFTIQARLCDGLGRFVAALGDHVADLRRRADRTQRVNEQHASLTDLLTGLISGSNLALEPFTALADAVVVDARQGEPLHLINVPAASPATDTATGQAWLSRHVAGHCLNVAQVAARAAEHFAFFAEQPIPVVLAGLLHDVGMLELPFELLAAPTIWTAEQHESAQRHVDIGATVVESNLVSGGQLVDAIRCHHARGDNSGYPAIALPIAPLTRLLAACDVYAALRCPRPYRAACSESQTLTEMALMVQRGQLDAEAVAAVRGFISAESTTKTS